MGSRNAAPNQGNSRSSSSAAKKGAGRTQGLPTKEQTPRKSFVDGSMREDLIGIALAVVGIALFVAVTVPGNAMLTVAISDGLKHVLGLGAYVVPFVLVFWGATFFFKTEGVKVGRLVIGLAIMLVALMALLSLFSPGTIEALPYSLFYDEVLVGGGGYVGSGISWALMTLFGRVISAIVLVGVFVAGLVIAGVSISTPFLALKNFVSRKKEDHAQTRYQRTIYTAGQPQYADDEEDDQGHGDEAKSPFARFKDKLGMDGSAAVDEYDEISADPLSTVAFDGDDSDITVVFDDDPARTVALDERAHSKPRKRKKKDIDHGAMQDSADSSATVPVLKKTQMIPDGSTPSALEGFTLPDARILGVTKAKRSNMTNELRQTANILQQTLEEFSLPAKVVGWLAGPTVTMFKVELPSGVRLAKLTNLADDIALALAASAVRIAQIPGTSLVGVEIPNKVRSSVLLGDILPSCKPGPLQVAIGEDVDGEKICVDLAKMPHLLIAGTTGSGKSVCLNAMIMTILMRATPAEVRMILIDPKRVEMSLYNGIPHLFVPPVTEPKEAASALKWAVAEMERRLKVFEGVGAKNIGFYNQMIQKGELTDEDGNHPDEMPFIVIVVDELSDLMMVAGKDVEDSIVRIAQLARAAGIHLIIATQRPSSNVVTGMIKANITNRIGLLVATNVDSRVILDQAGAEKLVGNGDMLFSKPEWGKPKRIQGCFVSEEEIASTVAHLKAQGEPEYHREILQQQVATGSGSASGSASTADDDDDPLIWEAAEAVVAAGLGSTSMLQRRLKVGYARAGRIMDMLESKGVVGPQEGSRARDVLIDSVEDLEALRAFDEQDQEEAR